MTSQERVKCVLRHEEPDRVPIHDSLWGATVNRWKKEGLPDDIPAEEYFGYEIVPLGFDETSRFPIKTLEKTDTFITQTTPTGAITKNFRDYSTTPELIDHPIKEKKDWPPIKERLYPDYTRVDWVSALHTYQIARSEGKFIACGGGWGYDKLQAYMRSDQLLMAMVDDPDWVKDMILTLANLNLKMIEMMIGKGFNFDGAFFSNDMGYRSGPLFSPQTHGKTHKEADEMVFSFCHEHNMPTILHCCGYVKELIPHLIEVGLDCLQPLEVKAGMDVRELKEKYGDKLSFMGGIDVRAMANPDPNIIEEEIRSKFEVAKKGGGYIYHSDHSIPNNVSFKQYKRVMELVKKYGKY